MIVAAVLFGALLWQKGKEINNEQELINILGATYTALVCLSVNYYSTALPYVATERTVLHQENVAGMYSAWAYSFAQVAITYPTIGYYWSAYKVFWYFYTTFCTFLFFVYRGMFMVSVCPNLQTAVISTSTTYPLLHLFSGFFVFSLVNL
ncbi:Pleiotropic drug resistance protein 3 [Melia azedarach]|uniref:Pleiotropic drug resistance protein 3 n=1 Tax=Melia azedarach TaxID=155640 RepID=A0ACC1YEJ3_MELAZ|nr:Pleiotropic drug resistance protein 3 [Melia azedarach]